MKNFYLRVVFVALVSLFVLSNVSLFHIGDNVEASKNYQGYFAIEDETVFLDYGFSYETDFSMYGLGYSMISGYYRTYLYNDPDQNFLYLPSCVSIIYTVWDSSGGFVSSGTVSNSVNRIGKQATFFGLELLPSLWTLQTYIKYIFIY